MTADMNRRAFITRALAAAPLATTVGRMAAAQPDKAGPPVVVFSKHLQFMDYKTLAKTCRELGLDGVDLTVRPGGHVEPDRVDTDLPAAVEAIRAEGLSVPMITTRYTNVDGPNVRGVFARAGALGIPFARVGNHTYDADGAIGPQLEKAIAEIRELMAVAAGHGLTLGYHNHSGMNNLGGPLWDLHQAIMAVDSPHFGSNFDTGHAMVEGAFGAWQVNARLMAPVTKMVAVKDFVWKKDKPEWVRLGKGICQTAKALRILRELGNFSGPVSMHFEYNPGGGDQGMVEEIRATVPVMRGIMKEAGYTA